MLRRTLWAAALVGCVSAGTAQAAIVYGIDNLAENNAGSGGDRLIRFDTANPLGTVSVVGRTGVGSAGFSGMDFAPATGQMYGVVGFGSNASALGRLFNIDINTGTATLIGSLGLPAGFSANDLSWNPVAQQMQMVATNNVVGAGRITNLYNVNLTTGAAALVGSITGLPVSPNTDQLPVGLATDSSGVNFLHDIVSDRMYRLTGTAAAQMSSTIGLDTNFSQGMVIDWAGSNEWLLGSISNTPVFASQVRLMNNATGGTQSILVTWPNTGAGGLPQYETGDLAIIPEPATASLLGLALAGLALRRRHA